MEIAYPGEVRDRLNALILAGQKRATTGLQSEYADEAEAYEHVGERLVLVDNDGEGIAIIEVRYVELTTFGAVTWEHAAAEGEGDANLEDWRQGHRGFWSTYDGLTIDNSTGVVCIGFDVVERMDS
jgi:uncharacterized protein YhfF